MTRIIMFGIALATAAPAQADIASWYGQRHQGHIMANGRRFDPGAMTAASRAYPLGSVLHVTSGQRSVTVRVTDRTANGNRRLDLSQRAAQALGIAGVAQVRIRRIKS